MEIKLTENQLNLIKDRLMENLKEEIELRKKEERNELIGPWDFASLSSERGDLEYAIENGFINT